MIGGEAGNVGIIEAQSAPASYPTSMFRSPDIPPKKAGKSGISEDMGADQNLSAFCNGENIGLGWTRAPEWRQVTVVPVA